MTPEDIIGTDEITATLTQQLSSYATAFVEASPRIATALILLLIVWGVVSVARFAIRKIAAQLRLRSSLVEVFTMLATSGIWLFGILIALTVVFPSITPGRALTTLGLGSVAIGFAFKDTFENFLAGILILLREPFKIGDHVECDDCEGEIEEITIRDTRIRQTDGQLVVMPNHELFQNPVTVRTDQDQRRTSIICGVAYGEDVDHARRVIYDAVEQIEMVHSEHRPVQVFAKGFGASSIDFEIAWWAGSTPLDIRASRDKVVAAVKHALDDAGIEIPFPYRTLTFSEPLPTRSVDAAQPSQQERT